MQKYKNNLLIKNIIILFTTGVLAKILGMISKIMQTNILGIKIISLYALTTPVLMLIITICQFSFQISISKLSAENKYNNKKLLLSAFKIGIIVDLLLILLVLFTSKYIALLIHHKNLKTVIEIMCPVIPLITITSIQRGFLYGKEDMFLSSITNIIEELIKIILIIFILPIAIYYSDILTLKLLFLFNILIELVTMIILNKNISKYINNNEKNTYKIHKKILGISIPTTLIRLISATGYFLEPIILINALLELNYNINYITLEYGVITSYIIPILSFPNFFSMLIASALLPNITKLYNNKQYEDFNKKIAVSLFITIIIGIMSFIFILIFAKYILKYLYNTNLGINYIRILGPFFILIYIQPILSIILQATEKTNILLIISIINTFSKYISLFIFCNIGLGINSLIVSMIISIITTTILLLICITKLINKRI